jgi:uncharacterized protein YmfQ (DUF2313 family)
MSRARGASNEFFMRTADVAGHNIRLTRRLLAAAGFETTDFGLPGENDDV